MATIVRKNSPLGRNLRQTWLHGGQSSALTGWVEREKERETDRRAGRQTDERVGMQADRQAMEHLAETGPWTGTVAGPAGGEKLCAS